MKYMIVCNGSAYTQDGKILAFDASIHRRERASIRAELGIEHPKAEPARDVHEQLVRCHERLLRKRSLLAGDPKSASLRRAVAREAVRLEELAAEVDQSARALMVERITSFAAGAPSREAWAEEWLRRVKPT